MSQELPEWANTLLVSLEIEPVDVKLHELHRIAQSLDAHPDRDAILVGFISGYAAGLAEGSEMAPFDRAHAASVRFMERHLSRE